MLDGDDDGDEADDDDAKRNPGGLAAVTAAIEVRRATTENDRTSMTAELGRSIRRGRAAAADLIVDVFRLLCIRY